MNIVLFVLDIELNVGSKDGLSEFDEADGEVVYKPDHGLAGSKDDGIIKPVIMLVGSDG